MIETEIGELDEAGKTEFLGDLGLSEPGLNRLVRAGYDILGLHTFFSTTSREVRAWTIRKGTGAAGAAGAIHTDFEKGFIRAEIVAYDDFIEYQGETGRKKTPASGALEGKGLHRSGTAT